MSKTMRVKVDIAKFKEQLNALKEVFDNATRPAAQAGAQIVYERAREIVAAELTSNREHYFYGQASKALPSGSKKAAAYGPYKPGSLYRSIYQVFSKDNSFSDFSTYHVSWNADKAPYGGMVEVGTSTASPHSFIGRAVIETRSAVKAAIKQRYIDEVNSKL